jgi:hypothetical protein
MTLLKMFVAASLCTFGACKSGKAGDVVAKLEGFQKAMCECKDKACAEKVNGEMTAWGAEMAKTMGKGDKPDPEVAKKSADVMTKYSECMTKLLTGGSAPSPAAPPAASAACSPEHTKNEAGKFCVKLPAAYKLQPEKKLGDMTTYTYKDEASNASVQFEVKPYKETEYEVDLRSTKGSAEARKGTSSDLPNSGKYWLYTDADNDTIGVSQTRNDAVSIQCYARATPSATDKDTLLAICKSLLPL